MEVFPAPCTYKLPYSGVCEYDIHLQANIVTYDNPVARGSTSTLVVSSDTTTTPKCVLSFHRRLPHWTQQRQPDGPARLLMSYIEDARSISTPEHVLSALKVNVPSEEPSTYAQAMKSSAKVHWHQAMLLELAYHEANMSFESATLPPGKSALGMRWVFKIKYDDSATEATRQVARYKARLDIQGHTKVQGVDFKESYTPVIGKEILRLMLTLGAVLDYEIDAMDVITAFLNGEIDCEVYVKHPPGFGTSKHPRNVLRVLRSVYGLKQAPRLWFQTLATYLREQGYTQLVKDRCVFTKIMNGRSVYIGVYGDDLVIMAPTKDMMTTIKNGLS
ncbi:hypothetical protein AaE_008496, partial [Aphanomyces astaci]